MYGFVQLMQYCIYYECKGSLDSGIFVTMETGKKNEIVLRVLPQRLIKNKRDNLK